MVKTGFFYLGGDSPLPFYLGGSLPLTFDLGLPLDFQFRGVPPPPLKQRYPLWGGGILTTDQAFMKGNNDFNLRKNSQDLTKLDISEIKAFNFSNTYEFPQANKKKKKLKILEKWAYLVIRCRAHGNKKNFLQSKTWKPAFEES